MKENFDMFWDMIAALVCIGIFTGYLIISS